MLQRYGMIFMANKPILEAEEHGSIDIKNDYIVTD